ncbi:MAG: FHA domain-containing protein [Chloroflexi bacterium]|nr:FHA domain-containing protein [Chloroflexota bacterium]
MIRCPVCGATALEGSLYCSECGSPLWEQEQAHDETTSPQTETRLLDACPAQVQLWLERDDVTVDLPGSGPWDLGRAAKSLPLTAYIRPQDGVSRRHARLYWENDRLYLVDLGSTNGTKINGQRLQPWQPVPVRDGDVVQMGRLRFYVHLIPHEATESNP